MIDHGAARLALRTLLATLSVCTTGSTTLAASATGGQGGASAFTRAAGSFLSDGFAVGMELTATGFATSGNNGTAVITALSATVCTVSKTLTTDTAAAGCALAVGVPSSVLYENIPTSLAAGSPYLAEQYLPGPAVTRTVGHSASIEATPTYVLTVGVPVATGTLAADGYVGALLTLFAPGTALTVGSDSLRVRGDPAPFAGQLLRVEPGWMVQTVTIPLRTYATNSI